MTKQQLYEKARALPLLPGVYIIRDKKDEIIYVGKAKRLRTRVSQYFREGVPHDAKVSHMIANAFTFDVIVTQSEFEALVLECSQIKQHMPKYNILLKDDKGYSYVRVGNEAYPRVTAVLQKADDGAEYIGPFISHYAVSQMVETAVTAFGLPTCSRRFPQDVRKGRPCLNAHIGRCCAVCSGKITREEYLQRVQDAVRMIRLGKGEIVRLLREKMQEASDRLDFEAAARYRDQIAAVEKVSAGQKVVTSKIQQQDIISFAKTANAVCAAVLRFRAGRLVDKREFLFHDTADDAAVREEFYARYYLTAEPTPDAPFEPIPPLIAVDRLPEDAAELERLLTERLGSRVRFFVPQRGDALRLVQMAYTNAMDRLARESGRYSRENRVLDELAGLLGLSAAPVTIESYDISNWGDGTSVAGMIVFENGRPKRSGYRRFQMRTVSGTDDYASMAETLTRRVLEYEKGAGGQFGVKPDLILLDGGRGQLSVVQAVLRGTAFADVPVFGMVKDSRHRTSALVAEGGELALNLNQGVFAFVTSIQDEVHRFAISYQREKAKKKTFSSTLTRIEHVGPSTAKALLAHFKTVGAVASADRAALSGVKGVSRTAAEAVYAHFHPEKTAAAAGEPAVTKAEAPPAP